MSEFSLDGNYEYDEPEVYKSFDFVSDLHVEHWDNQMIDWNPKSAILIVAGDISNSPLKSADCLMQIREEAYDKILFVDGNHEHYNGVPVDVNCDTIKNRLWPKMIQVLDDDSESYWFYNGTLFIGCNGWYNFKSCEGMRQSKQKALWHKTINDARMINFGIIQPEDRAIRHADSLVDKVERAQDNEEVKRIVVVTHTIPVERGVVGPTHPFYTMNGGFHNTEMERVMDVDVKKKVKHWVFGHTHFVREFTYRDVHFYCFPRGYKEEWRNRFDYEAINISLEDNDERT